MPAAYDNYDYPAYWDARNYEHDSEVVAIKAFLSKIPQFKKFVDIGAGFGRLAPQYMYRAQKSVLVDPSSQLLAQAKKRLTLHQNSHPKKAKSVEFVHSRVENLDKKFKKGEFDVVMMVRVMHHIDDPDRVFDIISRITSPGGYFILEFANKMHGKALFKNFIRGNFTFPLDIFPQSKKNRTDANIPFLNYHPDILKEKLGQHGFTILDERSVSNIRSPFIKEHIPVSLLVALEEKLQTTFARFNFGPSIFLLARKDK